VSAVAVQGFRCRSCRGLLPVKFFSHICLLGLSKLRRRRTVYTDGSLSETMLVTCSCVGRGQFWEQVRGIACLPARWRLSERQDYDVAIVIAVDVVTLCGADVNLQLSVL
jgi:hypothetical protein